MTKEQFLKGVCENTYLFKSLKDQNIYGLIFVMKVNIKDKEDKIGYYIIDHINSSSYGKEESYRMKAFFDDLSCSIKFSLLEGGNDSIPSIELIESFLDEDGVRGFHAPQKDKYEIVRPLNDSEKKELEAFFIG